MDIPKPSEQNWGETDSQSFLSNPAEFWDVLPQPYRMIDKVLDRLLDMAWESILTREAARSADLSQKKHPSLMLSADTQGLSVSCSSSLACVSSWLEDGLDITAVQMADIGQEAYLISTVDDMGIARVFALSAEKMHLLKILNKTEDINQRSVCATFELSEGGDFGAALMSCNGALWLDIYHFPLQAWLEDLKQAASQSQAVPVLRVLDRPLAVVCGRSGTLNSGPSMGLVRTTWTTGPDVDPRHAALWPNALEIACSAVCQSSRYIALGLGQSLVSVWDRQTGEQFCSSDKLSTVCGDVSAVDSVLARVMFVECGASLPFFTQHAPGPGAPATAPQVHLLASSRSGTTHVLTTGRWKADAHAETLSPRPGDAGRHPAAMAPVAFLRGLSLVVRRNGEMLIVDAVHKATVCGLMAPTTHLLARPWAPVYALDAVRKTLFVRGDRVTGGLAAGPEDSGSHLLVFRFGENPLFTPYTVAPPGDAVNPGAVTSCEALERACDLYLRQRFVVVSKKNNMRWLSCFNKVPQ
ncbi:hypothetical protein NHX12_005313 [Muraenolepis orangiensis]|uniref:WD repeat-containing protein 93 n=1 Tax=Muraenolepis orangiensis TaxID=630683 RepID=A0A9Q0IC66_9TELE|nr:hypothetical protein NHX12_005313 [Muraenolepis orangiensis]